MMKSGIRRLRMDIIYKNLLSLLRGRELVPEGEFFWYNLYDLAAKQGVLAVVWDVLSQGKARNKHSCVVMDRALMIRWAINVDKIEQTYLKQKKTIAALAHFFAEQGIRMLLLKGYGLSLNYPVPWHRPCGDIDIWLFGIETDDATGKSCIKNVQAEADELLREKLNISIDEDKHHHTVFYFDGVMVENHYDFLNVHAHVSNRVIERRLQALARERMECVVVDGEEVYLPSADFNALFILRHTASHFAAEKIGLRHLLDWKYFVEKDASNIDWGALEWFAKEMNMHRFLYCMNAICVDFLGLSSDLLPHFERNRDLEHRVLNEIFYPEFSEPKPLRGGLFQSLNYKLRRWWANRWKHRIVYREDLVSTFFVQVWSHLMKPKTLRFE